MRIAMLLILGSLAGSASAQVGGFAAHPAALGGVVSFSGLEATPTMLRIDAKRRADGLTYLAANAHTATDIVALAENCHKITATPNYCALPEMQKIAGVRR